MTGASVPSLVFAGLLVLFALLPLVLQVRRGANVDSPWFWAYWFGIFALVALFLAWPKFQERQSQIEREFQGRTRAAQNLRGHDPDIALSSPESTEITLWPLFAGLATITLISWIVYLSGRPRSTAVPAGNATQAKASPS